MIIVYLFLSMAFFKVFPEFAFPIGTTALGSFLMALVSAAVMFATTLTANLRGIRWLETGARGLPWETIFVCILGTVLATFAAWLLGVGFSTRFFDWAKSYRGEPIWVVFMLAAPPAVHCFFFCADIMKLKDGWPKG